MEEGHPRFQCEVLIWPDTVEGKEVQNVYMANRIMVLDKKNEPGS